MDLERKKAWVKALRSGEYKQTQGNLQARGGFCCLGVACDLYAKETGLGRWEKGSRFSPTLFVSGLHECDGGLPPEAVYNWFGITMSDELEIGNKVRAPEAHNDNGVSFEAIARAIEEQW